MNPEEMRGRTQAFALRIIKLVESLPKGLTSQVTGRQLMRCGTSVGANYRAACRAKSKADFISKMRIVEEEADESIYWMDLIVAAELIRPKRLTPLREEADQILAIVVSSIKTARRRK